MDEESWTPSATVDTINSKSQCAALCTENELCGAYLFDGNGCAIADAKKLVGANPLAQKTTYVHINTFLVPGEKIE